MKREYHLNYKSIGVQLKNKPSLVFDVNTYEQYLFMKELYEQL